MVSISLQGLCDTMQLPFFSSDPVGSISDCRGEFHFGLDGVSSHVESPNDLSN